jgi:hypothetical protein
VIIIAPFTHGKIIINLKIFMFIVVHYFMKNEKKAIEELKKINGRVDCCVSFSFLTCIIYSILPINKMQCIMFVNLVTTNICDVPVDRRMIDIFFNG